MDFFYSFDAPTQGLLVLPHAHLPHPRPGEALCVFLAQPQYCLIQLGYSNAYLELKYFNLNALIFIFTLLFHTENFGS